MIVRLLLFLLILGITTIFQDAHAQSVWSNEPAGSTTIVDCNMSSQCGLSGGGWYSRAENLPGMISPSGTQNSTMFANNPSGGSQVYTSLGGLYNEVYVGWVLRTSNPFEAFACCASKMFFVRGPNTNGFFGADVGGSSSTIYFGHNTGGLDNSHICPGGLGLGPCGQNVSRNPIIHGQYTKLEIYIKASTTATSRDGIVRWWIGGILVGDYTTFNYPGPFNEFIWTETISGNVGILPHDKTWTFDHLKISIPNCPSGGCTTSGGGGGSPTTQPPSQVQDLVITPLSSTSFNVEFTTGTNTDLYDIRFAPGNISWGAAQSVSLGTCKVPYTPGTAGLKTGCSIAGLQPDTTYQVQLVGKKNPSTFSLLSNIATGKTATSPSGGGGGTTPVVTTTYDYYQQFSGVQGKDGWGYLESDNTPLVFNPNGDGGLGLWEGSQLYQAVWSTGFHPGAISVGTKGTKVRFTVPTASTAVVSGSVKDYDTSCGTGVVFEVKYNGVTKYTRTIGAGDAAETTYSFTQVVVVGDTIDFEVSRYGADLDCNVTMLNPIITLSTGGETGQVPVPTITNITPISGLVGSQVVIAGANFGATIGSNTVKFSGVTAVVSAATTTELTVTVPVSATTGNVTVETAGGTATGSSPFTVSTAVIQPAPSSIQLLSTDTYRVVIGDVDVWDLRGSTIPFVVYRNGSCGACNLTGYSLVYSTLLNTVGLEFIPGKYMYWDTKLKEWVIISGSVPYTPPMYVQGTFSFTGTASAGFNVYRSDSAGGTKTKLPLLLTATDRTFTDAQHSFGCYDITSYGQNGEEGPHATEKCTIHGQGLSRDIGLLNPKLVIDFKGRMWELRGSVAPYVPYVDGICRCAMAGYSLRYVEGEAQVEFLPGKWMRFDDLLDDWVIVAP